MDEYRISETTIYYKNIDTEINANNRWNGSLPHYQFFMDVMHELGQLGFYVSKDKDVSEIIRKDYYCGSYNGLKFKAHRYPAGFEIEFYQNIVHENPHGGYYDFEKYEKMPYLQKLIFRKIANKLGKFLEDRGVANRTEPFFGQVKKRLNMIM